MQWYKEPKPLIFYKCHSYTFICRYTQNQSHWYFTNVIHTHSYADIHRIKAIDILQVSFIHIHMQIYTESRPLIFYKCHSYTFICRYTQNQGHWYFTSVIHTHSYADIHRIKAIDILQVSFIHIHMQIYTESRPLIFYKCHSYTFICRYTQNQSHWYFTSVIHTHSYADIHRIKAIDILQVSFIHIHMQIYTESRPLIFYKCHSYTFICRYTQNQSHWYFTSVIHTHSYADIHRIKAIDILQVSFIHIHMQIYTESKPLIFYKCHSYTFICRYTQNQSHWYFTSVIHTHSYADIHRIKAIDILQVSFKCSYIKSQSHWYFTSVIHTHSYADIHRIKAIDILQVSFIHIHMQIYTESKPLIFYKCHSYTFICRYTQNQSHWYFTSVIHTHSYADIHRIKAIDILQVSSIHIHQTIQELLCIFKVCYTRY